MRKPIHYIRHFDLQGKKRKATTTSFDHVDEMVYMLSEDLNEMLRRYDLGNMEIGQRKIILESVEKAMRDKFNGIRNKTLGQLPDTIWVSFHRQHMNRLFYQYEVKQSKDDATSSKYLKNGNSKNSPSPSKHRRPRQASKVNSNTARN